MSGRGRPTKLTPTVAEAITQRVALGVPRVHAARLGGVDPSTLRRWLARGRAARSGVYRTFLSLLGEAESRALGAALACIMKAARSDWRAARYLAERLDPVRFASQSPAFLLNQLLCLAEQDDEHAEAYRHLAGLVAQGIAQLRPLGMGPLTPPPLEGDFGAKRELEEAGLDPDEIGPALDLLERLRGGPRTRPPGLAPPGPDDMRVTEAREVPPPPDDLPGDEPPQEPPWTMDER